ncbi:beta strand repeat-containing protein [Clostridium sp. JS66]|uniref:beta strand repeat-containing protein n=1 Tax=Clostridium sp. JS66 TaxID=3064705 RepID=UPI00298E8A81|nr:bacterial Ig-like domain-containing protein [Clostridium sp. JS66]WPC42242.1 bacterial Ig-like domain-containing protein [Clostridium sp. JS66]
MNNKKLYRVLSTAAIASAIAACVGGTASAKVTDVLVDNGQGTLTQFDYTALKASYAMDGVDATKAKLYNDYKAAGTVSGYYDDVKKGIVSANDVKLAYSKATSAFDMNAYTESDVAKLLDLTGKTIVKYNQTTNLSVSSVSAITKTKVEITFNTAVDAATKDNFSIAGVTVTGATLSADRTKVDLDITGADWSTAYTVKATGLKVAGTAQPDLTGTFTSLSVNDAYSLSVTADDTTVIADAGHTTTLRAKLIDKATGAAAANVDGMVIQFSTSAGNLANSRVTVQNGEADVTFISETKTSDVTAKIDAQINEASNDYKALIGKVFGTTNITLSAQGPNDLTKAILTGAQSDIADRVTLHFNRTVAVKDFVQQRPDGTFVTDKDGNAVTTNCPYQVVIKQPNGDQRLIRGFQPVAGDDKSMVVILQKKSTLTDNTEVDVNFTDTVNVVNSNQSFILTDPRPAEPTSVAAQGLAGVNVVLSEPIVAPDKSQIAIDAGKIDFANKDKFNAPAVGFITTGDFDQNKFTDTRNVLSLNFGTYKGDVKAADSFDGKDHKDKDQVFFTAGNHSVQLSAIEDFAGLTDQKNISTTQTLNFTVQGNDVVPAVASVVAESPEQFRVKFTCDLASDPVMALYAYNTTTSKYDVFSNVPIDSTNGNLVNPVGADPTGANILDIKKVSNSEYVVQLKADWTSIYNTTLTNKNYYNGQYALHFETNALVNPANGKKSGAAIDAPITGTAISTPDVTSPVINNIVAAHDKTENAYDVIMSKPVKVGVLNNAGAVNSADGDNTVAQKQSALQATTVQFLGKDASGNTVTVDGTVVPYDTVEGVTTPNELESSGDTIFKVVPNQVNGKTIQSLVNDGTFQKDWTVVVKSISDDVGNTAATLTKTFTFTSIMAEDFYVNPGVNNSKFEVKLNGTDKDTIKVTFTEPVSIIGNVQNAADVSNYTLDGNLLPKGSSITLISDVGAPVGTTDIDGIKDNTILITLPDGTINDSASHTLVVAKSLKSALGTAYDTTHAVQFVLPTAADAATKVTLGTGSLGTAGDKTITGLTASTAYSVSVNGAAATDMTTDATGALTGLDNNKIYLVTAKVVAPTKVTLGAGSVAGAVAGDKTITGLTATTVYSVSVDGAAATDMTTDATGALTGLDNTKTYVVTAKVAPATLSSIAITTPPTKTTYTVGDAAMDTTGLVVTGTYSDASTKAVTPDTITGFDTTSAGTKTITVTVNGKTATFNITVVLASTPAVKTADADLGSSVAFDTATKITLNGTDVTLTNVKLLGATYDAKTNIDAVVTALQADINAVGTLNGKYTVAKSGSKLTITSVDKGAAAKVDLTGSDTATGATLLGFTTLTAVNGAN